MSSYGPTIPAGRPGADRGECPPIPKWSSWHASSLRSASFSRCKKPYGRPLTIDRADAGRGPLTGAWGTAVSVAL